MEPLTLKRLKAFLRHLGDRFAEEGDLYLLGGSALCLLGNPRTTMDIDFTFEPEAASVKQFEATVNDLAAEMQLYVDVIPIAEFVPLPPQAYERRQWIGRYGQLNVYIFDLYTIALSKISRGFESDLEDVMFMLHQNLIEFKALERHFHAILPNAPQADIIPSEFQDYFEEIRRRVVENDQIA